VCDNPELFTVMERVRNTTQEKGGKTERRERGSAASGKKKVKSLAPYGGGNTGGPCAAQISVRGKAVTNPKASTENSKGKKLIARRPRPSHPHRTYYR